MCQSSPLPARQLPTFPSAKPPERAPYQNVRAKWQEWEALGASPDLVRQIRFGARLPWGVDRSSVPPRFSNAYNLSARDDAFAQEELSRWLAHGFAAEITLADAKELRVISPAFVIYGSKPRLVVDYSYVNGYMEDTPFRMERLLDLAPQLCPRDKTGPVTVCSRSTSRTAITISGFVLLTVPCSHFGLETATSCLWR